MSPLFLPGRVPVNGRGAKVNPGAVVLGDGGTIMYGSHGAGGVRIIPEKKMQEYQRPDKTLPRVREHHHDWLEAIRYGSRVPVLCFLPMLVIVGGCFYQVWSLRSQVVLEGISEGADEIFVYFARCYGVAICFAFAFLQSGQKGGG